MATRDDIIDPAAGRGRDFGPRLVARPAGAAGGEAAGAPREADIEHAARIALGGEADAPAERQPAWVNLAASAIIFVSLAGMLVLFVAVAVQAYHFIERAAGGY